MSNSETSVRCLLVGLLLLGLVSCHQPPCQKALEQAPVFPTPKLQPLKKQYPLFQQRRYDLCLLRSHGVRVIRLGQTWRLIFPSEALFVNDTHEMNDAYKPILDIAAHFMGTYSKIRVTVAAYSDDTAPVVKTKFGDLRREMTLLQAKTVAHYLWSRHVDARLLVAKGDSGRHPVAWNGSAEGRSLNRRVEVSFRYYHNNTAWY